MSNRLSRRDLFPLLLGSTIAVPLASKLIDLSPKEIIPLAQPGKIITLEDPASEGFKLIENGELRRLFPKGGADNLDRAWGITLVGSIPATKIPILLDFEFPKKGILRIEDRIIPVSLETFLLQASRDGENYTPGICGYKVGKKDIAFLGYFTFERKLEVFSGHFTLEADLEIPRSHFFTKRNIEITLL